MEKKMGKMKSDAIYNSADNVVMVKTNGDEINVICNEEKQVEKVVQRLTTPNISADVLAFVLEHYLEHFKGSFLFCVNLLGCNHNTTKCYWWVIDLCCHYCAFLEIHISILLLIYISYS